MVLTPLCSKGHSLRFRRGLGYPVERPASRGGTPRSGLREKFAISLGTSRFDVPADGRRFIVCSLEFIRENCGTDRELLMEVLSLA